MMKKLFQTKCPIRGLDILVCAVTLFSSCNQQSYNSPDGYDLEKPQLMQLGKVLNEISGLTYNTENSNLLAIADSKEKVFELSIDRRKLKDYSDRIVGPHSDLEDLVKVDSIIYLLGSKGIIYQLPARRHNDTSGVKTYLFSDVQTNDFESLYFDPNANGLIMLCKSCASGNEEVHKAYRFDLNTKRFDSSAYYSIDEKDVKNIMKDDKVKFKPSAAAINPLNKRLFILSSAGNLLVIADTHGQVIEAYHLNPIYFPQAEGICFAPNGDMYISNEGKYGAHATLLIFHYKPTAK